MNVRRIEQRGFTLIELAIGLVLIGFLLGSVLTISAKLSGKSKHETQERLFDDLNVAMLTYLKVNKYLPCPDTDGDGKEDRTVSGGVSVCNDREGYLPALDIGFEKEDEWGNPYYYRVNQRAESSSRVNDVCESASVFGAQGAVTVPSGLGYCQAANMYYCSNCSAACSSGLCTFGASITAFSGKTEPPYFQVMTPPIGAYNAGQSSNPQKNLWLEDKNGAEVENGLVFVIVSFGSDGLQTWKNCNNASTVERENCDGDIIFAKLNSPDYSGDGAEKRDFMTYMTVHDVRKALLDAGALE